MLQRLLVRRDSDDPIVVVHRANLHRELVEIERGLLGRVLGTGATLIPMEICTVDDDDKIIRVSADKDTLKHSPALDAAAVVVTRGHEAVVRAHFGL